MEVQEGGEARNEIQATFVLDVLIERRATSRMYEYGVATARSSQMQWVT